MVRSVQGVTFFQAEMHALCTFAPATLSVLLRPKFEPLLHSKERQFVYFLIGTFVPTVLALRWQQLAWKTSLCGGLFFSFIAKKISDTYPSFPRKLPHSALSSFNDSSIKQLSIAKWTEQSAIVSDAPTLLQTVSASSAEAILQGVIPGNYVVTVDEGIVHISDERMHQAVCAWLGKGAEEALTLEDVQSLKVYLRYRSLNSVEKVLVRQGLYNSLYPLIAGKANPVSVPCITGYRGESIVLALRDDKLVMTVGHDMTFGHVHEICIAQDGAVEFRYLGSQVNYISMTDKKTGEVYYQGPEVPAHITESQIHEGWGSGMRRDYTTKCYVEQVCYFSIHNEDSARLEFHHGAQLNVKEEKRQINKPERDKCTGEPKEEYFATVDRSFNQALAHLELLVFKRDQIIAFLEGNMEQQAQHVFANCCELLNSFPTDQGAVVEKKSSSALVSAEKPVEEQVSYALGPIWSPVANSEDSFFTWIFTSLASGEKSLRFEKGSAGRGMVGGTTQRNVTLSTGSKPSELKLEIAKSDSNDLDHYTSTSVYLLEKLEDGRIQVTPQGKESTGHCIPLFLGMCVHNARDARVQTSQEVQQDMDFILKVMTTLSDIKSSPDTMLVDKERELICNLQGNPIPVDRIKLISSQRQGAYGYPLIQYIPDKGHVGTSTQFGGITYRGAVQPMLEDRRS